MWGVDACECAVNAVALFYLVVAVGGCEYDAHGEYVEHFLEGDVLALHLLPDGVGTFYASREVVVDAELLELLVDGGRELVDGLFTLHL